MPVPAAEPRAGLAPEVTNFLDQGPDLELEQLELGLRRAAAEAAACVVGLVAFEELVLLLLQLAEDSKSDRQERLDRLPPDKPRSDSYVQTEAHLSY